MVVQSIDISDLMNKPYRENGRGPEFYDCWGLFMEIVKRLNRYLSEYNMLKLKTDDERNELFVVIKDLHFIRLKSPEDWCAVIFRIWDEKGQEKWHIGHVLPGCRRFIHVTEKTCVCTTSLKHKLWKMFFEGFYRYG